MLNYRTTEIPNLDLNGQYIWTNGTSNPTSPLVSPSPTGADLSGPSSRRTSFSSTGRSGSVSGRSGSASGRSGSGNSSRSTSFNLPNEARHEIRADGREPGEEVELDEEMDEETAAKHAAFVRARGRHYSNEAEAMKASSLYNFMYLSSNLGCSLRPSSSAKKTMMRMTTMIRVYLLRCLRCRLG
ncbi:hypothetical protein B0H10DRAFT_1405844 [Mycena sp. CBHHK59/15]|nr:hypothetical protein B0H10DRAFT_1405844 [Mycena sp. CBHHK59/15]